MIHRIFIALVAIGPAILLPGCAATSAGGEGTTTARSTGSRIWAGTCNRCHNLRPPRQFAAEEWPVVVDHMRTRADLTKSEAEAVAAYLRRVSAGGSSRAPGRTPL